MRNVTIASVALLGIVAVAATATIVYVALEEVAEGVAINFELGAKQRVDCFKPHSDARALIDACTGIIEEPSASTADKTRAYRRRADLHSATRQHARAIADFTQALALAPGDAGALVGRAIVFTSLGRVGEALADYEKAMVIEPQWSVPVANRGNIYLNQGEYTRALADFDRAIELDPASAYAFANRSNANRRLKYFDRAVADADRAIALVPRYSHAHSQRGLAHLELGRFTDAEGDFSRAIDIDPRTDIYYFNRALAFESLGQRELALNDLDRAVALDPRDASFLKKRAMLYAHFGRWREAIGDLSGVVALQSGDLQALAMRARAYENIGERDNAIADHRLILRFNPLYRDSQEALRRLGAPMGTVLGGECRNPRIPAPDRLADCAKAITAPGASPDDKAAALIERGKLYLLMNEAAKALADFEDAVKLKPGLAEAYAQRGIAKARRGDHAAAIADFDHALSIDAPKQLLALNFRANSLIQLGRFKDALLDLDKLATRAPNDPGVFYLRGLAHEKMGHRDQAISDYRESLKRFPQFGSALEGLRRLEGSR